ncbi:MAG: hypothetical protein ACRCYL_17250, partial [Kluyvera sp.]
GPAGKSVLRTTLACELQPAARRNSTSCLGSPQPAIPGGLTLSSFLRLADFHRGLIGFSHSGSGCSFKGRTDGDTKSRKPLTNKY